MSYDLPLSGLLHRSLLTCSPATAIADAAARMHEARCGSILVVDEAGEVIGIWTESDALTVDLADAGAVTRPVGEVMSTPVRTIPETATVGDATLRFKESRVRHLLAVDGKGRPVGIVSQTDIIQQQGVEFFIHLRSVDSVSRTKPLLVGFQTPMAEVLAAMRRRGVDAAIVTPAVEGETGLQDEQGLGIITARDVLRLLGRQDLSQMAGQVAGQVASFPLVTIRRSATLYQARNVFAERRIRHLGVVDGLGEVISLLTYGDILDTIEREYVRELKDALTEQTLRLQRSRQGLMLAAKVAEASHQAIMIADRDGIIRSVNPAFTAITGYTSEEAVGQTTRLLKSGMHDREFYADLYHCLQTRGVWRGEIWNRRKDGTLYPESATITMLHDEHGQVSNYVAVFSDISEQKESQAALAASRTELAQQTSLTEMILDTLPVVLYVKDAEGRYVLFNEMASQTLGKTRQEVIGQRDADLFPSWLARHMEASDARAMADDRVEVQETRIPVPDQEPLHYLSYRRSVRSGKRRLLIGAAIDITERKRAESQLQCEKQVLERIAADAPLQEILSLICQQVEVMSLFCRAAVLLADDQGAVFRQGAVSPSTPELAALMPPLCSGLQLGGLLGGVSLVCESLDADPRFVPAHRQAAELGLEALWAWPVMSPGGRRLLGALVFLCRQARGPGPGESEFAEHAVRLAAFAIERSRAVEALRYLATFDTLTRLPNRAHFLDLASTELERARRFGRPLTLLMVDIDHFKQINDTYGHGAGDEALRATAARLAETLRSIDFAGRMGGEEFAVALPETDLEGGFYAGERLREAIAASPVVLADGRGVAVTVSVGVAAVEAGGEDLDRLILRADGALYEAKSSGRNRVVVR